MLDFLKEFWKSQKTIWLFLGKEKPKYVFFNSLILAVFFYDFIPPFVFGKIVDFFTHYSKNDSLTPFYLLSLFLACSWTFFSVIRISCKNALAKIAVKARANARLLGLERLLNLSIEWHGTQKSGDRVQQLFRGSQAIQDTITLVYRSVWMTLVSIFGLLAVFLFLSPLFALFVAIYICVFFLIEFYFSNQVRALSTEGNKLREQSNGSIIESANNITTVKSLGFEKEVYAHLVHKEEITKEVQLKKRSIKGTKFISFHILNGISLGIFLLLIGHHVINGYMTVGSILIFFAYFSNLRDATQDSLEVITSLIELSSNLNRLQEIFNTEVSTDREGRAFPQDWKEIAFNDISFSYRNSDKGIKDLRLVVKKGEVLGIAGPSGSGKSTFAKLLIDLYQPDSGTLSVDEIPYESISHREIMEAVSVVPQEAELFDISLRENITTLRAIDEAYLSTVLDVAELGSVVAKLPQGLDTIIGEKGHLLSGGERQRVGIARALCKNSPITIFDEATSALDGATEKRIIDNVLTAFRGKKTFIFIAHRLSSLPIVS